MALATVELFAVGFLKAKDEKLGRCVLLGCLPPPRALTSVMPCIPANAEGLTSMCAWGISLWHLS